ncbi:hypothetical protein GUITHDRAFT_139480 [Guillardia theta CCMP2712]|uniref:PH domain-containing protein n=1 Tax=Guillardia theta (strain CCMP2712) TaxID=905079 RepID=L1J8M8_GUITC|nr:hypothetical protein GUITHDRAFT_139480 [Guillardia theta CCMP2712]EKX44871.1 hypothetical protein GUITHDRAFT_139480 [Guillardia theta CCMP2712]|eukprot:XP_005831851.1 hypothetical protein GUITHDRAFT_139480 [Guillardia theta CCMP2712]
MWFKSTDERSERLESVSSAGKSSFKFKYAQSHTRTLIDSLVLVSSSTKDVFVSIEDREKWMDEISMVQKMIIICITNTTGAIQDGLYETSWIYRSIDPHVWQVDGVIDGSALSSTFIIYKYARKSRSANKNLCWMFGQYGRLNNGIIGFLHLGYLASRFQRQMVVPNVAFVCSVNLPLTSLLVLEGLIYIQGYDVKLVSEDDFFSTCGSSPVVDVKGLEKQSHRETCQIDGRHLFETRDVTEHHMKSSFFHLRFHSRLVTKAKRFILEKFKGIPYAAVHFRNFEEDCIERVKDVIGHAYPGISNISSHLDSISPMCNPNVSWVLHESEEYSRIHRISLFISSESWGGMQDNVADADRLVKPQRECEEVECALIDMIVCMESIIFFGNPASTFSLNVGRLREQQFPFAGPNIFSTDRNLLFPLWFGYK